jgi:hypothetical protein
MPSFDKSKLVKNLASDSILIPYLDKVFGYFDKPWTFDYTEKDIDDAWHPSGDCLPSVTELYTKAVNHGDGHVRQISGGLRKAFMVGHFWHQLIQHIVVEELGFCTAADIERRGYDYWGEAIPVLVDPISPDTRGLVPIGYDDMRPLWSKPKPFHWVTGSGDFAPLRAPNGWTGIVDIKTMNGTDFKKAEKSELIPQRFEYKYLCQLNVYMRLFGWEQAMILGVNKDAPHSFVEFTYVRDDELLDAIWAKWVFVSDCLATGIEPTERDNNEYRLPFESENESV